MQEISRSLRIALALTLVVGGVAAAFGCGSDSDSSAAPGIGALDAGTTETSTVDPARSDAATKDATSATDAGDGASPTSHAVWEASSGVRPESACASWTLVNTADTETPSLDGGALTLGTSADAENMYYEQAAADLIEPPQLEIEATMRLVSGSASVASRSPAAIATFRYGSPLRKNILFIASGELFLLSAENTKGPSASVATTDAFHAYKVAIDTTTHAIVVSRDGVDVLSGTTFLEGDPGATRDITFGESSVLAHGVSEWQRVAHNAHALALCP